MSSIVWGLLAKSQTDDETIEEAIARIVAEHNADEESHIAAGQSLQSHKASDIIDHLAGSIIGDKANPFEYLLNESWPAVANLAAGSNCATEFPRIIIECDWESPAVTWGAFFVELPDAASLWSYEFIFRLPVKYEQYGEGNFGQFGLFYVLNLSSTTKVINGVYFSIEDGIIYGRVKIDTFDEYVSLGAASEVSDTDIWEISYNPTDKLVNFKINDVVIDSIDLSTPPTFNYSFYVGGRAYGPDEENTVFLYSSKILISVRTP